MDTFKPSAEISKELFRPPDLEGIPATNLAWALAYAQADMRVFPAKADKKPIWDDKLGLEHWNLDATTDEALIRRYWGKYPGADIGWAVPEGVVVLDVDRKHRKDGFRDFAARRGKPVDDEETPQASSPSSGRHLFYGTNGRRFRNKVRFGEMGLDTRALGGFVVLPGPCNGRLWVKPLTLPLLPAPDWVPEDTNKESLPPGERRAFRGISPLGAVALASACSNIENASQGARNAIRHKECYSIGGLIARGDLDYESALAALIAAARKMSPRPGVVTARVTKSVEKGMEKPRAALPDGPPPISPLADIEALIRLAEGGR